MSPSLTDVFPILISSDVFIAALDLPTFARLVRLSRYARAFLDCDFYWKRMLLPHLGANASVLDNLDGNLDVKAALQGLFCLAMRQRPDQPDSPPSFQKEIGFWWQVYHHQGLMTRLQQIPWQKRTPQTPPLFASHPMHNPIGQLGGSEDEGMAKFRWLDGRRLIETNPNWDQNLVVGRYSTPPIFSVVRVEALRSLLPQERFILEQAAHISTLSLVNCSFSTLSGWPDELSNVEALDIVFCLSASFDPLCFSPWVTVDNMTSCRGLTIPAPDLRGMPSTMDILKELDLSRCEHIQSLAGLPASLPSLETLILPPTLTTLEGLPPVLDSLRELNMLQCDLLADLRGMPQRLPALTDLDLPPALRSLAGISQHLDAFDDPNMLFKLEQLTDLSGFPSRMPAMRSLLIPFHERFDIGSLLVLAQTHIPYLSKLHVPARFASNRSFQSIATTLGRAQPQTAIILY